MICRPSGQSPTVSCFSVDRALADNGAKFTVMHVMEEIPGFVAVEMPDGVLEKVQETVKNALIQTEKTLHGAKTELKRGHVGLSILEYAKKNKIDFIVITSHKTGIENYFLGSTASRVVRHAERSVHVIR